MAGKFSINKLSNHLPGQPAGGRFQIIWTKGELTHTLCGCDHWAFDSCAIMSLFGFSRNLSESWWTEEHTQEFVDYILSGKATAHLDYWKPGEVMFSLTDGQLHGLYNHKKWSKPLANLALHPKVRLIDKFKNKSHGETIMWVFRLSLTEDFCKELPVIPTKESNVKVTSTVCE